MQHFCNREDPIIERIRVFCVLAFRMSYKWGEIDTVVVKPHSGPFYIHILANYSPSPAVPSDFLVAPCTNEWVEYTGRSAQHLPFCGWKFDIQGSLLYIPHSQHPPDNVKLLQKQLSNDEAAVPVQDHEMKEEKKKIKRIWQLTHYLCRYPWGTSTPASPHPHSFPLSDSLSVSGGIKSLSHEGLVQIIPVSHRRLDRRWDATLPM